MTFNFIAKFPVYKYFSCMVKKKKIIFYHIQSTLTCKIKRKIYLYLNENGVIIKTFKYAYLQNYEKEEFFLHHKILFYIYILKIIKINKPIPQLSVI